MVLDDGSKGLHPIYMGETHRGRLGAEAYPPSLSQPGHLIIPGREVEQVSSVQEPHRAVLTLGVITVSVTLFSKTEAQALYFLPLATLECK